jgi:hypothetical protein
MTHHFSRALLLGSSLPVGFSMMPSTSPSAQTPLSILTSDADYMTGKILEKVRAMNGRGLLTHALFVQAVELQSHARWRFLGARPYLIDCVKCMAKDSVFTDISAIVAP